MRLDQSNLNPLMIWGNHLMFHHKAFFLSSLYRPIASEMQELHPTQASASDSKKLSAQ